MDWTQLVSRRFVVALFLSLIPGTAFAGAAADNDRWVAGYSSPGFPGASGGVVGRWNTNGFLWITSQLSCRMVPAPNGTRVPAPIWIWNGSSYEYTGTGCLSASDVNDVEQRGSNIYLGGDFLSVDGNPFQYLVRWDGQSWSAPWVDDMGAPAQLTGPVFSLAYDGTQNMYVGGSFGGAGSVSMSNIGRLDGFTWEPLTDVGGLAEGTNGSVFDVEVGNGIFMVGDFTTAGGENNVNNAALWMSGQTDGSWSRLDDGINWGPGVGNLSVGNAEAWASSFGTDPGIPATNIAVYDVSGGSWSSPGDPADMPTALGVQAEVNGGNRVFARGDFTGFGDPGTVRLAEWKPIPGTWEQPPNMEDAYDPTGFSNSWALLAQSNDFFYFDNRTDPDEETLPVYTGGITRFDGVNWHGLGQGFGAEGVTANFVSAVYDHNGEIFVGGAFANAGDAYLPAVARWQGGDWVAAGEELDTAGASTDPVVYTFATYQGNLVMGGCFESSGATTLDGVARWNGSAWVPIGAGFDSLRFTCNPSQTWNQLNGIHRLLPVGSDLYAGGSLFEGSGLNGVARWDGASWNAVGGGATNGVVFDLAEIGGDLFVAGTITTVDNFTTPVNRIAKWNGVTWDDLSGGVDGGDITFEGVYALAKMGSDLYAAGNFATAGGVAASNIARWDGASWNPVGDGLNGTVFDLEVVGTDLYAVGVFTQSGSALVSGVAKWNGASWTPLGYGLTLDGQPGGFGRELYFRAASMRTVSAPDGESSGELFVGGYFNFTGDKLAGNFGIYQLGDFTSVFSDGFESGNTAQWTSTVP